MIDQWNKIVAIMNIATPNYQLKPHHSHFSRGHTAQTKSLNPQSFHLMLQCSKTPEYTILHLITTIIIPFVTEAQSRAAQPRKLPLNSLIIEITVLPINNSPNHLSSHPPLGVQPPLTPRIPPTNSTSNGIIPLPSLWARKRNRRV